MKTGKILRLLLAPALLCVLFCLTVQRAEAVTEYPLWVVGTQVTSDNRNDVFGDGKVKYDPASSTLTLDSYIDHGKGYCFQVPEDDGSTSDGYACIYYDGAALTITLTGTNSVTEAGTTGAVHRGGIYTTGDLTIKGSGDLTADAYNVYFNDSRSYGIYSGGSLTFRGTGSVTVQCGEAKGDRCFSYGVYAVNQCVIESGTVTATGGEATGSESRSYGVFSGNSITVSGGTVSGIGGTARHMSYGIQSRNDITISGGKVTATGGTSKQSYSQGLSCGNDLRITGGTVTATGGTASHSSHGIYTNDALTITGGTVTATGGDTNHRYSYGIYGVEVIKISGGTVTATGGKAPGKSCGVHTNLCHVESGTLEAVGGKATASDTSYSTGMEVSIRFTVSGGKVNAAGGEAKLSYGIDFFSAGLTVTGGEVYAAGGAASSSSIGLHAAYIKIEAGSLTGVGGTSDDESCGIYTKEYLTVSSGKVTATGGKAENISFGIRSGNDLTISGGKVTAAGGTSENSSSLGISCGNDLRIIGGTVTGTGGTASNHSFGIYSNGTLTITGGAVTGTVGTASHSISDGIHSVGVLTITGGNVTATGGTSEHSYSRGLSCGNDLRITGGTVTGTGGTASHNSYGIYSNGTLTISTISGGTTEVKATGGEAGKESYGINSVKDLIVQGGTLEASGTDYGVYTGNGVSVEAGTVTANGSDTTGNPTHGIFCKDGPLAVSGGTVEATGGKSAGSSSCGVYTGNDNVVVSGSGSLTATGGAAGLNSSGVYSQKRLQVEGGTLNASGINYGVYAKTGITVSDGEVEAWGGDVTDNTSCGMYSQANAVNLSGGTVAAYGGDASGSGSSYGIWALDGDVVISGCGVTVSGGDCDEGESRGILCSSLRVTDGVLMAYSYDGCGVFTGKDVIISGGETYAYGGDDAEDHAIHAQDGSVTISGGTVTACFGASGIHTQSDTRGDIDIKGDGTVVSVSDTGYGIDSARDIAISGGTVKAEAEFFGMNAGSDLTISGGDVAVQSEKSYGVYVQGSVTIEYPAKRVESTSPYVSAVCAESGISIGEGMIVSDPEGGMVESEYGKWTIVSPSDSAAARHVVAEPGLYTVSVASSENGTVTADPTTAHYKDTISVTVTPETGYGLKSLVWTDASGTRTETIVGESFEMPGTDITITAQFQKTDYTVTVEASVHGSVTAWPATANYGDEITLLVTPDTGYELDKLAVKDAANNTVAVTGGKFTMPASNVTVKATFKALSYTVTAEAVSHGSVTPSKTSAKYGDTVTLTVNPDTGYELSKLTVKDAADNTVTVTGGKFTMPASNVTVKATFKVMKNTVTGSFDGGKLTATVTGPANSMLIAARYEDGRLAETAVTKISAFCAGESMDTGLTKKAGCNYRLMLVDGATCAPLCKAWSEP